MELKKRLARLAKLSALRVIRSDCFKRLAFSKTMWGLFIFLALGIFFTVEKLWTAEVLDFFKWLGPFFFVSRGMDSITNFSYVNKKE